MTYDCNATHVHTPGARTDVVAGRAGCRQYEVRLPGFFRMDLTISALRRLPANVVDVLTSEQRYLRAFAEQGGDVIVSVQQSGARKLMVTIDGGAGDDEPLLARVRWMLGLDCDLSAFNRAAARIPWLRDLAIRMRGIKPPRYPSLWEALVNAIAFQQLSLHAASAIVGRLVVGLQPPILHRGLALYPFPGVERVLESSDIVLRAAGLSRGKIATLRRAGEAIMSGALSETILEEQPTAQCAALLGAIKGIGPWTATVVLLRGLGRLDVFPLNDTSVVRNVTLVAGAVPVDVMQTVALLRPQQGMLYYHLLLARLDARGEIGLPSGASSFKSNAQISL